MLKNTIKQNKLLILTLGTIAALRPLTKITGLIHLFPTDRVGSIILTILISVIWLGAVLFKRVDHPVIVLAASGLVYAIWAIILSVVLSPLLTGSLQGPITNPFALVSVIVTNLVWGAVVGLLAMPFVRMKN
ncbi:hypothetical protein LFYK43_05000 [Ligilactobacillus salitolerans]|uniref:Integral membrane protein n=1 Tax=Ligilactobacillus salitolerans TaxID=1808352 RepID=A0A401IR90_9LACO|nr:hypothetical protein [Ligilactobacillus salitolerans]GBG94041.1 hypothetical protein LFYK43_05000 [Ligilactobacillus salitolerans]